MPGDLRSHHCDTIYAVSSGFGKAAIAIVRVSGPQCRAILRRLCPKSVFENRLATLATIIDENGAPLDRGIVLSFVAPGSFTGEDMVEFQVTGGRAVVSGLLFALATFSQTRPAEAGEFAFRAFFAGKLDLVEVEGLASVVEAETRAQLRQANLMASGQLSRQLEDVRSRLLSAIAVTESLLDFSDVEDAGDLSVQEVVLIAGQAKNALVEMLGSPIAERLHQGLIVVIAGAPNAGKSTLLNYFAKRDVAIVSAVPGTTRDTLEVPTELSGYPVTFIDTAGVRETPDFVENLGIARALKKAADADLILWLYDDDIFSVPAAELIGKPTVFVKTKADLHGTGFHGVSISVLTSAGVDELISKITEFAERFFSDVGKVVIGSDRQRVAARDAAQALSKIEPQMPLEFVAEELRTAAAAIGRIVGRIGVEEVLGEIFSRLCIGK